MQHKIIELCNKVSVMYEKAMLLHRLKYDTPKEKQDQLMINILVDDIQALASDIAYDRSTHPKLKK